MGIIPHRECRVFRTWGSVSRILEGETPKLSVPRSNRYHSGRIWEDAKAAPSLGSTLSGSFHPEV